MIWAYPTEKIFLYEIADIKKTGNLSVPLKSLAMSDRDTIKLFSNMC